MERMGCLDYARDRAVALEQYKVLGKCLVDPLAPVAYCLLRSGNRVESETDEQLTHVELDYLEKEFGYPFLVGRLHSALQADLALTQESLRQVVHRRDLQGAIQKGVESLPDQIKFQLHTALVEVDYTPTPEGKTRFKVKRNVAPPTDPDSVKAAANGKAEAEQLDREEVWLEADLVIAADGIRSVARRDMLKKLGEEDHSMLDVVMNNHLQADRRVPTS